MTDLNIGGMAIAPDVVETIVTMAARDVDGVACVGQSAGNGLISRLGGKPSTQGVEVDVDENDALHLRAEGKPGNFFGSDIRFIKKLSCRFADSLPPLPDVLLGAAVESANAAVIHGAGAGSRLRHGRCTEVCRSFEQRVCRPVRDGIF